MRKPDAGDVEAATVERRRTEDRVVDEALGARRKREEPERRTPPSK